MAVTRDEMRDRRAVASATNGDIAETGTVGENLVCELDATCANVESKGDECPYPAVDWAAQEKTVERARFHHPAVYPEDSILKPYMEIGKELCEGADCFLIGSILPVVAALLDRDVYMAWGASRLYPNIFAMLVGKAGDRKSSTIKLAERIALECLPENAFLPLSFSPESMFNEYSTDTAGKPDKLWVVDDANPILSDWKNSSNGERVGAQFLRLYDCNRLTENFQRNKSDRKNSDISRTRRVVPETSTSVLFGATFHVAAFQGNQIKAGLARRFQYYVADEHGRVIVRPPKMDLQSLVEIFKPLLRMGGEIDFSASASRLWADYQQRNRNDLKEVDVNDEARASRLSSAPTYVLKVSMLFEACRCAHSGRAVSEISEPSLECAIRHVDENLRGAGFLESIAERSVIAERAEMVIATVRKVFQGRPLTIYATRSQLTYEFCRNPSRLGAITTHDLYGQIIPALERQGLAKLVLKKGKLEVYAFRTESTPPHEQ